MTARILPGAMIHIWDHLVITLRDGERETASLSWYSIRWSASLGTGNVALFEVPVAPGGPIAATLTDDLGLGERQQRRLRGMGYEHASLADAPVLGSFVSRPFRDGSFGVRIEAPAMTIEASWDEAGEPFWVDGEGGGFNGEEDIWAAFVGAASASIAIDGVAIPGAPFDDDVWQPKLGRSLSSAHAAFSEVRVTPVRT
jgi:hypothetical protein